MEKLQIAEVDRERWVDFERLFSERGGPKSCWCMVWRASPTEARARDGKSRRAQIKARVDRSVPIGLIGYLNDRPVAWCSIAPRDTYRPLGGPPPNPGNERVWSLACLYVRREHRGSGLTAQLIEAAAAYARARGATVVEAYPVDAISPSYRFMGFVHVFAAAGFHEVGRAGTRRHVMRLDLSAPPARPA